MTQNSSQKNKTTKKTKANAQTKKRQPKPHEEKTFKRCEVATKLVNEETGEAYIMPYEEICKVCEEWKTIREFIVVVHDQEVYSEADEKENPEHKAGTIKNPDVHIYLNFGNSSIRASKIAEMFGTLPQNVGRIEGAWGDAVSYAMHQNAPEKHQYEVSDLFTNIDVEKTIETEKAKKKRRNLEEELDDIVRKIEDGEIREFNRAEHIDAVLDARKGHIIDRAFKRRTQILENKGERNMEVIYIEGESGSGKTTYAKEICTQNGWSYYVSSSSNDVLDGYKGQDALILDDLRPSALGLSDLLKLLDNHTSSSVKSRYKNKVLECKALFITTVLPIDVFFHKVFEKENEPIKQLKRRCGTYLEFKDKLITLKLYDETLETYKAVTVFKNPIRGKYQKRIITEERVKDTLNFLGVSKDDVLEEVVKVTSDGILEIDNKNVSIN